MSDSFQPIQDSFVPDSQPQTGGFHPADTLMNMYQRMNSQTGNSLGAIGQSAAESVSGIPYILQSLGPIAQIGKIANQGNQDLSNLMAEKGGELAGKMGVPNTAPLAAIPGGLLGTASEVLLPRTKLGAAGALMGAAGELGGIGQAAEGMQGASKPGTLAHVMQGTARIPPSVGQYALDHPEVLGPDTPTIEEATKNYVEAIGGLKGKVSDLSQKLNKTVLRNSDYDSAIDRAGRLLNGTEVKADGTIDKLTPQDALTGLQSINQALRNKMYTAGMAKDQIAAISQVKEGLLDFLQNNGSPKIREAGQALFEAHVKDAFSQWLPVNKYGSTDALRTIIAGHELAGMAGAVIGGHPGAAIPLAASAATISPKMWGFGIRALSMPGAASQEVLPYMPSMLSNALSQNATPNQSP